MYIIIVGGGAVGAPLVELATAGGHEVVVVEADDRVAETVAANYDCLVINGDARTANVLEDAGIDRADAAISTTDDDATNVMVMLLAAEHDVPSRVSVVNEEDHMAPFRKTGANTIENPDHLIAEHLYRAVQRPSVKDVLHLEGEAEVFEITVAESSPLVDLTLEEAAEAGHLEDDLLIVAVEHDGEVLTPSGSTRIRAGDVVTVFSKRGFESDVLDRFAPRIEPV
ncbi:MAG: trk system potassium uptake protein TrkA [Halobacteriales archaeon]|jgi:trk system potassium uptake protein TrkA